MYKCYMMDNIELEVTEVTEAVEEAQKEAFAKENEIEKLSKQSLEA